MHTLEEWQQWYQAVSVPEPRPQTVQAPRRPSEEPLLQSWDNRLAAQNIYFDMCIAKKIGHAHVADEKNVAFLRIDQGLAKRSVEKAVAEFIREGSWPALSHRECLHLVVRIQLARKILAAILQETPQGMVVKSQMPDLGNREHAIQWLLLDLWNLGGKAFLTAMANDFCKKREEAVSEKTQIGQLVSEQTH
jgi:hypothetical protein